MTIATASVRGRATVSLILWICAFELLCTILWFSRAWVVRPVNWIVDNRMRPAGIEPDWGINAFQYLFLPILPIVTLGLTYVLYLATLQITGDVYIAAGLFAFATIYASGGIHLDGFVDTMDALNCHDKDKWSVMKEPHIGALGAYNMTHYQIFFSAGLFYLAVLAKDDPWLISLLCMSFVLARINLLYVVPKSIKEGLFKQDEIVHMEPPYLDPLNHGVVKIFERNFRYVFGVLVLILTTAIVLALGGTSPLTLLLQFSFSLAILFFMNKVVLKRAIKNLGFISGDVLGYSITIIEALSLALTLVAYKAQIL